VPLFRLTRYSAIYYEETGKADSGHSKLVVMTAAELSLALVFALDLVRSLYYVRAELKFKHMVFNNFILVLITLPSLAILFEIWHFEHPIELIHSASAVSDRRGNQNATTDMPPFVRDTDEVQAVFVMAATPAQALANLVLIGGHFMGDGGGTTDAVFTGAGGVSHVTVGAIFLKEAFDDRYAHRKARTTLAGLISVIVGAAHILAAFLFVVMHEEIVTVRANLDEVAAIAADNVVTTFGEGREEDQPGRCIQPLHRRIHGPTAIQ